MMFTQLRTRLLFGTLIILMLLGVLVLLITIERNSINQQIEDTINLKNASREVRELSLYVQSNAHDADAYTLGYTEHREDFFEQTRLFQATLASLEAQVEQGLLGATEGQMLNSIGVLRTDYDGAAQALFTAADVYRFAPSDDHYQEQLEAWERADAIAQQLEITSQNLALQIDAAVEQEQASLATRNRLMLAFVVVLGMVLGGLVLIVQWVVARALDKPLRQLLSGVEAFTAGDHGVRVPETSRDEIGILSRAFNTLATTLAAQTTDLEAQTTQAEQARSAAETARLSIAQQLEMIEQQRQVIREMSVPLLPLSRSAMVMPLVGSLDSERITTILDQALTSLENSGIRYLIMDVTGVPVVDTQVAHGLLQVMRAARLLGAEVLLAGIRPEVAQAIIGLGVNLDEIRTFSSLQSGIAYALRHER